MMNLILHHSLYENLMISITKIAEMELSAIFVETFKAAKIKVFFSFAVFVP